MNDTPQPEPDRRAPDDRPMTLGEHLEELRRRLLWALLGLAVGITAALTCGRWLVELLQVPWRKVMGPDAPLRMLEVAGGMITYLKVALAAGIVLSAPWWLYQLWLYLAPALYRRERRVVLAAAGASAGLFVAGAVLFLLVFAPYVLRFLLGVGQWLDLEPTIRFQGYVSFVTTMMLVFGVAFQTPLVVLLLARLGVVSVGQLNHYRRHVIVVLLATAALLTPPDVVSQLCLAGPMWLLYELGILLAWLTGRRRATAKPPADVA